MSALNNRERSLVALGAAVAANCIPCVEYHIPEARQAGLSEAQIKQAVQIADRVRRVPAGMVMQAALARIDEHHTDSAQPTGSGCRCTPTESGRVG